LAEYIVSLEKEYLRILNLIESGDFCEKTVLVEKLKAVEIELHRVATQANDQKLRQC